MPKFLFILFFFIFSFSHSQNWKFLYKEQNKTYYYKPNTENTAWIKIVSNKIEYYQSNVLKSVDGYKLLLWQFECNPKKMGIKQIIVYSKNGKLMRKMPKKGHLVEMEDVTPKTNAEIFLNVFCNKEK